MADMLASPSELAAFLQSDVDTASATLALELATGLVQAACGQRLVQVTETVTLDVDQLDDGPWLPLPEGPVTAVGPVLVGAAAVTDYAAQLRRGRLYRASGWRGATLLSSWSAPSTVTVTYTHGFPAGDQRLQLARSAVLAFAAVAYGNPAGAVSEQIDDYAVRYEAAAARLEASPVLAAALRHRYGRPPGSVRLVAAC